MDDQEIHPTASLESWFGVAEEEVDEFLDKDLAAAIPDVSVRDITEEIDKLTENVLSPIIAGMIVGEEMDEDSNKVDNEMKTDTDPICSDALSTEVISTDIEEKEVEEPHKENSEPHKNESPNVAEETGSPETDVEEDADKAKNAAAHVDEPFEEDFNVAEKDETSAANVEYQSEYESEGSEIGPEVATEHGDDVDKVSNLEDSSHYMHDDEEESRMKIRFNLRKRLPIHSVNEEYGSDDYDLDGDNYKATKKLKFNFSKKNYRRKRPYTNEAVKIAIKMVMSKKLSLQEASREFNIPRTSLHNFVNMYKRGRRTGIRTISPGLTKQEESEMVSLVLKLSRCGKRYSHNELRYLVQYYLVSNDRPVFKSGTLPTMGWIAGLVERQQELVKAKSKKNTKVAVEDVEEWQEQIEDYLINDWDLDINEMFNSQNGKRIYCFNAFRFLINCPGESADKPSPVKKEPGTEDDKTDLELGVILGMSADGRYIEPLVIIPEEKRGHCQLEDIDGVKVVYNKSGKVDEDVALKVVRDLDEDIVQNKIPKPVVFFVNDKHDLAHFSVIEYCWENQIIIICLPPRTTKTMTPFEISIWPKLRSTYSNMWKNAPKGFDNKISMDQFISLFAKAWDSVTFPQQAIRGFRKSGLIPLNVPAILKETGSEQTEQQHQMEEETQLQLTKQQNEYSVPQIQHSHFLADSNNQNDSSELPDLSPMEERSRGKLEGIEMCLKVIENFVPTDVLPVWNQRRADYRGRCELAFKLWRSVSLLLKAGCAMASIQQMADGFFNPFGADFSSTATFFQKPLAPVTSAPSVVSSSSSRSQSPAVSSAPQPKLPRPRVKSLVQPPKVLKKIAVKPLPKRKKLKINKSIYSRPKTTFTNGDSSASPTEAPPFVKLYQNPFLMNDEMFDESEEV